MKYKNLRIPNTKITIAVLSLLATPELLAQKKANKDSIREKQIEEVVMVGYGSVKKSDLTGSVAVVSGNDLKKAPVSNVAEALTGKIAGLSITSTEGSPDAEVLVRVRGGGSITQDSSPLIIVDGFPVNSIGDISPSDIENVTVLKDASSTAIYGARGAYGVILITTKGAKGGKLTATFNSYIGYKFMEKQIDVLSPYDYAKWQYEFAALKGDIPSYEKYFGTFDQMDQYKGEQALDWQKNVFGRTGVVQSQDFGIRGGSEKTSFSINLARYDEKTILLGSDFRRNNISFNLKNKPKDNIDLSVTFRYSDTKINGSGVNDQNAYSSTDSRLQHVVGYSPINIPSLITDDTDEAVAGYLVNPYTSIADNNARQDRKNYSILGGFGWKITKNLQFQSNTGIDFYRYNTYRFYGRSTYYVNNAPTVQNQGLPALIMGIREDQYIRTSNTLNYNFKNFFGKNHSLKLLAGQEYIGYNSNTLTNTIHGYPKQFTFENTIDLTTQGAPQSVDNNYNPEDRLLSFFGRLNYAFKDKYLLTATFRADGSSKFIGDNKWGYFPSVAAAWKVSDENFLKDVSWLKLLKMRASYGQAGNNNVPGGQTFQNMFGGTTTWINGVSYYLSPSKILANPDLKWETNVTQNAGLDFELFKGRISGTVDVYKNVVKDNIFLAPIAGTPYDYQYQNFGENENKGIEATLMADIIRNKDFKLSFSINSAFNKNRLNSLSSGLNSYGMATNWASTAINNDYLIEVGKSIGSMYGYLSDGRYEVSDFDYANGKYTLKKDMVDGSSVVGKLAPGSMKLKDINGDGKVDASDRTIIGNALPKSVGGFTLNSTYKNFDLSAAFNWSIGNKVYNANKIQFSTATQSSPNGQYRNLDTEMADGVRWTNIDSSGNLVTDPTALAALNANTTMWSPYMARYVFSDWAVEDGSFLRLNTLTLGYTFPNDLVNKLKLTKIRLYVSGYNVFILTKYSGMDPEVSTIRKTALTPGVDFSAFPKSRQVVFGLNLNF